MNIWEFLNNNIVWMFLCLIVVCGTICSVAAAWANRYRPQQTKKVDKKATVAFDK